jgi:hypothetical protein
VATQFRVKEHAEKQDRPTVRRGEERRGEGRNLQIMSDLTPKF